MPRSVKTTTTRVPASRRVSSSSERPLRREYDARADHRSTDITAKNVSGRTKPQMTVEQSMGSTCDGEVAGRGGPARIFGAPDRARGHRAAPSGVVPPGRVEGPRMLAFEVRRKAIRPARSQLLASVLRREPDSSGKAGTTLPPRQRRCFGTDDVETRKATRTRVRGPEKVGKPKGATSFQPTATPAGSNGLVEGARP